MPLGRSRKPAQDGAGRQATELNAIFGHFAAARYDRDGKLTWCNDAFAQFFGSDAQSMVGKPHSDQVWPDYVDRPDYEALWQDLVAGEGYTERVSRRGAGDAMLWLETNMIPLKDDAGQVTEILELATDVTFQMLRSIDSAVQFEALDKTQAIIQFEADGTIAHANSAFCGAMGHALEDLVGKHHRIFCDDDYVASQDYAEFWEILNSGTPHVGEYLRYTRTGEEIYLNASYIPVVDRKGKVVKVVKFATAVTDRRQALDSIGRALSDLSKGDLSATPGCALRTGL